MAYDANILQDDEEKKQQQDQAQPTGGLITGSGPAPSAQQQSTSSDGTGEYTPLVKYLDANKNRHQGVQLAGKVGEDVDAASQAQTGLGENFRTQADQATVGSDQGLLDQVKSAPTAVTGDPDKKAEVLRERDATYAGPSLLEDLDSYGDAKNATTTASERAKASETEGGKTALLDTYFGRPNYTSGEKALDQYLVSNDSDKEAAFGNVQNRAADLTPGWEHLNADTAAYGKAAADKTAATRAAAQSAISGGTDTRKKKINDSVTSLLSKYDKDVPAVQKGLADLDLRGLSPDELTALGLDKPTATNDVTYGVDPTSFLTTVSRDQINPSSVASKTDYDELNALAELAGQEQTFLKNPEKAGSMNDKTPFYQFRKGDFDTATSTQKTGYEKDLAATKVTLPAYSIAGQESAAEMPVYDALNAMRTTLSQQRDLLNNLYRQGLTPTVENGGALAERNLVQYSKLLDQVNAIQTAHHMDKRFSRKI
jgi:hypothetical protein